MAGMLPMMKNFIADWRAYHATLGKQDEWIRRYASQNGYSVNPRWMVYTNLKLWLSDSEAMYGRRYCPCFEPTGESEADEALICPCEYLADEVAQRGWCHCTLFGRADLTGEDYKRAEGELMDEYRNVPLKWVGGVLDTRGMHIDPLRGLLVPDAIHQVKRVLGGKGTPLSAIVATQVEADHLERLSEMRGFAFSTEEQPDGSVLVHLGS